jgi:hypothetical protein
MLRRYPGLSRYLELEPTQREGYNRSQYDKRAREAARWAVRYLILFCEGQEEKEVAKVITWEVARALARAILGDGSQQRSKRHHIIAQQMANVAGTTLLAMIDNRHYDIVSKAILEAANRLFGVSPPEKETMPNTEYKQNREQIERALQSVPKLA